MRHARQSARLIGLTALGLLCGCSALSPAGPAICAETRPERLAHARALTTAPTADDDLTTGAALLSVLRAGCMED